MTSPLRKKIFPFRRVHGATVARLTPDQTVGSSNLSGLTFRKTSAT